MTTILYPDSRAPVLDIEQAIYGPDATLINARCGRFDAVDLQHWQACDAAVVARVFIDAAAVPHLKRCRIVVRHGVGYDSVDLQACGAAGIPVCNVPDYGTTEVADSAMAMMLSFARGTTALNNALRRDLKANWTHLPNVTGRRLRGCTFGVIGLGRIGTAAALRARAFGMDVMFYDPHLPVGAELAFGFQRAGSLADLLAGADVISIHAPLNDATRNMIDAAAVAGMKPGAYLISTARGEICDTAALLDGLRSGRLAAVGLDVLPREPGSLDDPLVAAWHEDAEWIRGRVLLGPHAAFYSPASMTDLRTKAARTVQLWLTERQLINCVNAQYLKNPR